jgi:hypothetical protein
MRTLTGDGAAADLPSGAPVDTWELAAIGPRWAPAPGEQELAPVPGRLELHGDALVFRAADAVDASTGTGLVSVIPAGDVREAGPLSPGAKVTPSLAAGSWMPAWQRRLRCPGFVVATSSGPWLFDGPEGKDRAATVAARYVAS